MRRVRVRGRVTSYSDLRRNLAAALDRVAADREPLIITRDRGKPTAAPMSLDDFASCEETRHLLARPSPNWRPAAAEEGLLIAQCRYRY